MLYARDARARAAAEQALVAVLSEHADPIGAAETLLDAIRLPLAHLPYPCAPGYMRNPAPVPQHPGDIGGVAGGGGDIAAACLQTGDVGDDEIGAASDWPARVVRLLPKWVGALSARQAVLRRGVAKLLVNRVFAAPQDAVLVQVCAAVA
jgi:hypothetical protein